MVSMCFLVLSLSLLVIHTARASKPDPFWGCGLLGRIQLSDPVWKGLIADLRMTNVFGKVPTWNWDTQPSSDEQLDSDFLFFPNAQCAGTSAGAASAYLDHDATLPDGVTIAELALGGNEPDQVGFCQEYTDPTAQLTQCDGFMMRAGQCIGKAECNCTWDTSLQKCRYQVTGCGMWPLGSSNPSCTGSPFPFWCFGKGQKLCDPDQSPAECCSAPCRTGMVSSFSQFFVEMAYKGYTYATTPIVAGDLSFVEQLMEEAGCGADAVKQLHGQERLRRGCPTHTAFHFYTTGCPSDPDSAVQGFVNQVNVAKSLNAKYALAGTIVNELGSLKSTDTQCRDDQIAAMMGRLFDYLKTDALSGVVSQMVWFNEDQTGGTFDLRLVKDGKLSKLGEAYKVACGSWAQANGVNVDGIGTSDVVV